HPAAASGPRAGHCGRRALRHPCPRPPARRGTRMTTEGGSLSVLQGTALTMAAVLGVGVVTLPALAVEEAGPASILAWGVLIVVSLPLAATFAALGARHPDGGGVATYARLAFGNGVSTMVGWAFFLAIPI